METGSVFAVSPRICESFQVSNTANHGLDSIRSVFLDRDGVINVKLPYGQYVTEPEALQLCTGAAKAIAKLNQLGLRVIVVTNQRGISLGLFSESALHAVHTRLHEMLFTDGAHLDAIYYCPHARDACDCRKPLSGMFLQGFRDFPDACPANSLMIGDSLTDIQAGKGLGMPTVFIEGVLGTQEVGATEARMLADYQANSLATFVKAFF